MAKIGCQKVVNRQPKTYVMGIALSGKRILDVDSGLGGLAFYLAQQPDTQVTGIELNPWMVQEATRSRPTTLRGKVDCCAYVPQCCPLPITRLISSSVKGCWCMCTISFPYSNNFIVC